MFWFLLQRLLKISEKGLEKSQVKSKKNQVESDSFKDDKDFLNFSNLCSKKINKFNPYNLHELFQAKRLLLEIIKINYVVQKKLL